MLLRTKYLIERQRIALTTKSAVGRFLGLRPTVRKANICPLHSLPGTTYNHGRNFMSSTGMLAIPLEMNEGPKKEQIVGSLNTVHRLPLQCSGCGAFSQTKQPDKPGYFDLNRRSTRQYLGLIEKPQSRLQKENQFVDEMLRRVDAKLLESAGVYVDELAREDVSKSKEDGLCSETTPTILCVRCHELTHHHSGQPISHPSIDMVRKTISESPHKYNHIYHLIDAADFPMSLLPRIHELLETMPLRSRNRRTRRDRFYGNRKMELSFVVTRADLLAPTREKLTSMTPWIQGVLRDALGRRGRQVRLGNVRCVSAQRGWGTSELRDEIWEHGGASWLVGKANVGKSRLVHEVFPKGRMSLSVKPDPRVQQTAMGLDDPTEQVLMEKEGANELNGYVMEFKEDQESSTELDWEDISEEALLPPRPPETNYPAMPVVTALPGTTASPIRIPFGTGKGELVDLPGLERTELFSYVKEQHRESLVMKKRVRPSLVTLKSPQQSLLVGGFIRITPRTPDLVFLAYNFTPLEGHRTRTEKAVAIQQQTNTLRVENLADTGTGDEIQLAGSFPLRYDVTKVHTGPITAKNGINISIDRLPYRVMGLDLLIEGCGWVEVTAQVRTKDLYNEREKLEARPEDLLSPGLPGLNLSSEEGLAYPIIDVFTPRGKFVGVRQPLNASVTCRPPSSAKHKRARPPRSVSSLRKKYGSSFYK